MRRLLAISDIHGNLRKFEAMLAKIGLKKDDRLIIMGDNVDRGLHNVDTVFKIMDLKEQGFDIVTLIGNHEDMLIRFIDQFDSVEELVNGMYGETAKSNGTLITFIEYMNLSDEDKKRFLREIKSYKYSHVESQYIFVHAGIEANVRLEHQSPDDLIWIRDGFTDLESHGLPYTVIFGHTPTKYLREDKQYKIWRKNDKIGIDCGASFGGKLACLDVSNDIEYYV